MGFLVGVAGTLPAWSATRHVVLLFDERPELPGLAVLEAELIHTLAASADHIEVYREAMDLSRFSSSTYETYLRDSLRAKYANKKIDVAVAVMGPALDFLLRNREVIFPGTPIVFCGLSRQGLGDRSLPSNVRGVLVKREFAPTLDLALRLQPKTQQVVVVGGTSEFDARLIEQARNQFRSFEDRIAFTYFTTLPLQQLLAELSRLPPQTIVLFISFFQDASGAAFVPHDVVQRVSAAANAPVYAFVDQYLGRGIVGGNLYSLAAHGTEAGKLVLQALANPEASVPVLTEVPSNKIVFDWRQMQRWGISQSNLPAGSEIRFRDPTAWDQYPWQIVLIVTAILAQAALIIRLFHEQRRRRKAETESRQRMSELAHMNRVATAGELSASIAHEVNQPLMAIATNAAAAKRWLSAKPSNVEEASASLAAIQSASVRASSIINNLRAMFKKDTKVEEPFEINGVVRSVLELVRTEANKHGVEIRTQLTDGLPSGSGHQVQLQQVVLNLAMNAIEAMDTLRLGQRELRVRTELHETGGVKVSVEDTGKGIAPADLERVFQPMVTTKATGMGIGLSICRSIIEEVHKGKIWAAAGTPRGSTFQFVLPTTTNTARGKMSAETIEQERLQAKAARLQH
jgi:signal transduction histidine kinase